jgi:folate-binding protein YgfZ
VLASLGAPVPDAEFAHVAWEECLVARIAYTGGPGYRVYAPIAMRAELKDRFVQAGALLCDLATADAVRLEFGRPRHGVEFSDAHLVHEAQLLLHVSFTKGCYLGQEIVERVRSRGNVNRLLTRLVVETADAPAADTAVMAGDKEAGRVSSAAYSPALGKTIAFALLRAEFIKPETEFVVDGTSARVAAPGRLA